MHQEIIDAVQHVKTGREYARKPVTVWKLRLASNAGNALQAFIPPQRRDIAHMKAPTVKNLKNGRKSEV